MKLTIILVTIDCGNFWIVANHAGQRATFMRKSDCKAVEFSLNQLIKLIEDTKAKS